MLMAMIFFMSILLSISATYFPLDEPKKLMSLSLTDINVHKITKKYRAKSTINSYETKILRTLTETFP